MYEDEASFRLCGALSDTNGVILRKSAPIADEFGRGYGAWLLQIISDYFPNQQQISITDLDSKAGWKTIPGWESSAILEVLQLLERKGQPSGPEGGSLPWLPPPRPSL